MAGYLFSQTLHNNEQISVDQQYTRTLTDFRSLTYNLFVNGSFSGTGKLTIIVCIGNTVSANRIYNSRPMSLVGDRDSVTILLPSNVITVFLSIGTIGSVFITDSLVATG